MWLLNCWAINKSKEFFKWMKNNNSNILLVFILANYTSALQPINVILQCPIKHAFKMVFNMGISSYTNPFYIVTLFKYTCNCVWKNANTFQK